MSVTLGKKLPIYFATKNQQKTPAFSLSYKSFAIQYPFMEIDPKAVRRQLGLLNPENTHAIERVIAIELAAARTKIAPKCIQKDAGIREIKDGRIHFDNLKIESKGLANHLKGCTKATFFALTIGKKIDEDLKDHIENEETPQAMVLDAIGSVACEVLAQKTDEEISARARKEGYETTGRFSPGYGDWRIEAQKYLLPFLGAEKIGVTLTGSCLMLPRKSITAVKGWYPIAIS